MEGGGEENPLFVLLFHSNFEMYRKLVTAIFNYGLFFTIDKSYLVNMKNEVYLEEECHTSNNNN